MTESNMLLHTHTCCILAVTVQCCLAGRVTTVIATAVTSQAPPAPELAPKSGRGKGRAAAAKGPGKAPALRGRSSQRNLGEQLVLTQSLCLLVEMTDLKG